MRNKLIITILLLASLWATAYSQEKTKEDSLVGGQFRTIRAKITKKTCETFDYNTDCVKNIDNNIWGFLRNCLEKDTSAVAEAINNCLKGMENYDGSNPETCRKSINDYLTKVCERCKDNGKDTPWETEIRTDINKLVDEYTCYFKCKTARDFSEYQKKYKKGPFIDLANKAQDSLAAQPESKEEETVPKEPTKKDEKKTVADSLVDESAKEAGESGPVVPIVLGVLIVFGGGYLVYRKKKNASSDNKTVITPKNTDETEKNETVPSEPMQPVDNPVAKKEMMPPQPQESPHVASPDEKEPVPIIKHGNEWVLVGASVKGNGHIQSNMPCQDNHKYETLGNGWGIAVVSDGAGSAEHSELGSKVVVDRGVFHFKNLIEKEGWMKNNVLPTDVEWLQKSYYTLKNIRNEVEMVAHKNKVELKSLSATCLVVIYSPIGLLAAHVGDGRMGYKSASGEWRAMMTPHKGDEANQTIFLVSDFWSIPNYVMSGVLVPESIVVREPVKAFALMSDGCENTSWKCTTLNPATGKYYDQNQPFEGFFNPLEETLLSFHKENVPEQERKDKWYKFIESGTNGFVKEQDDKTMIYGVNVNI